MYGRRNTKEIGSEIRKVLERNKDSNGSLNYDGR